MSLDMPALVRPVLTGSPGQDSLMAAPILRVGALRPVLEDELPRDVWTERNAAEPSWAETLHAQRFTPGAIRATIDPARRRMRRRRFHGWKHASAASPSICIITQARVMQLSPTCPG